MIDPVPIDAMQLLFMLIITVATLAAVVMLVMLGLTVDRLGRAVEHLGEIRDHFCAIDTTMLEDE